LPMLDKTTAVISRVRHAAAAGEIGAVVRIATPETVVHVGDVVLAIGPKEEVEELRMVLGKASTMDLREVASNITTRQILVTRRAALGKTVEELNLAGKFGVATTR